MNNTTYSASCITVNVPLLLTFVSPELSSGDKSEEMKRFTKSNFAYAWQGVAVIILFGFSLQPLDTKRVPDSSSTIPVSNNNIDGNKNATQKTPQHGVKVSRYDISNSGEKVLGSSGMFDFIFKGPEIFLKQEAKPVNR